MARNTAATPSLVLDGETRMLVPLQDNGALARAIIDPLAHFSVDRMVERSLDSYADLQRTAGRRP